MNKLAYLACVIFTVGMIVGLFGDGSFNATPVQIIGTMLTIGLGPIIIGSYVIGKPFSAIKKVV